MNQTDKQIKANKESFDLYAVENAPRCRQTAILYHVDIENTEQRIAGSLARGAMGVTVRVYPDGLVNIERFRWFGVFGPKPSANNLTKNAADIQAATKEIWEWLTEWNFVKLIPIGPEDSEYFATSKLTGDETNDRRIQD